MTICSGEFFRLTSGHENMCQPANSLAPFMRECVRENVYVCVLLKRSHMYCHRATKLASKSEEINGWPQIAAKCKNHRLMAFKIEIYITV